MHGAALIERVKTVKDHTFEPLALDIFRYQATHNPVYRQYLELLGVKQADVRRVADIPFLPIQLFKSYLLQSGAWTPELTFTSSGTTGASTSRHAVRDAAGYLANARRGFEHFYGSLRDYAVLALLPAYLEREGSSLILMAQDFIERSKPELGGFFLYDHAALIARIEELRRLPAPPKILLLGVSFALLDLAEAHPGPLPGVTIMETGGMKGRRKEITREELHGTLQTVFHQPAIHSEYGMTELFSQAYSQGAGRFRGAPTLRAYTREITDPLRLRTDDRTGALNLIDLANVHTVSFIATEDLGRVYPDGSFEILGRLDAGDVRGCNLMVV